VAGESKGGDDCLGEVEIIFGVEDLILMFRVNAQGKVVRIAHL